MIQELFKMNFPEKLKCLRKEKHITQEELANKIFVSRTLISKYENGAIYPTEENAEKIALFFEIELSELIDRDDTIQLMLKRNDSINIINKVFSWFVISLNSILILLSLIPLIKVSQYDYSAGTPPVSSDIVVSPIHLTVMNKNPIVVITLLTLVANTIISCLNLHLKEKIWLRLSNYILFIINLFLIFFSIVFIVIYFTNNGLE